MPREAFLAIAISFAVFISLNVLALLFFHLRRAQSSPPTTIRNRRISSIELLSKGFLLVGAGLVIAQSVIAYQEWEQAGGSSLSTQVSCQSLYENTC